VIADEGSGSAGTRLGDRPGDDDKGISAVAFPVRIGLVFPGGGPEGDYYRFERALDGAVRVYFANSRIGPSARGQDHDPEALAATGRIDWILEAADRLRGVGLDVIEWACTSGSFIGGRAYADKQVTALAEYMNIPASSTSLSFVAALRHLELRRVAVVATYPEPAAQAFATFLEECDIAACGLHWLDAPSGWDAALIPQATLEAAVAKAARSDVDALLIPDTALPTLHLIEDLERIADRPVLTANAVTLWHAMMLAGARWSLNGHGTLLG
jgi:maleate cis-trans isomerase